jgi:hypothetical protein
MRAALRNQTVSQRRQDGFHHEHPASSTGRMEDDLESATQAEPPRNAGTVERPWRCRQAGRESGMQVVAGLDWWRTTTRWRNKGRIVPRAVQPLTRTRSRRGRTHSIRVALRAGLAINKDVIAARRLSRRRRQAERQRQQQGRSYLEGSAEDRQAVHDACEAAIGRWIRRTRAKNSLATRPPDRKQFSRVFSCKFAQAEAAPQAASCPPARSVCVPWLPSCL